MAKGKKHTILLLQFTQRQETRTYRDFESVGEAMNGVCRLYEEKIKKQHRYAKEVSYGIDDLCDYVDALPDMGILVFDPLSNTYVPHNREWIKKRIAKHLTNMAYKGM